jgi:hypothetical protein
MTPTEILSRLHHPLFAAGRAGVACTTHGTTITIWIFDGQMGARFRDIRVGDVNERRLTVGDSSTIYAGRGWQVRLCANLDAAITSAMQRQGVTW